MNAKYNLFLKFFSKKEYAEEFLNGTLFFNTSDYFARCDNKGQGDYSEGCDWLLDPNNHNYQSANLRIIDGEAYIVVEDFSSSPELFEKSTVISYSSKKNRYLKLISHCATYYDIENNSLYLPRQMREEFGDYCILICDIKEYLNRVNYALVEKQNSKEINECCGGFVEYVKDMSGFIEWHPYKKDGDKYSYQNEYRLTFYNSNELPYKLLLDKNLRDIALPIDISKVDEVTYKDGLLFLPLDNRIE